MDIHPLDARIASVATRQHGLISVAQLEDLRIPASFVRHRLSLGRWERVQPRVHRIAGAPATRDQALMAACLSAGESAVVSHRSAAWVWGFDGPFGDVVEVSVTRIHQGRPVGAVLHRSTDLVPSHCVVRRNVKVTTVARTLVDLGAVVPQWTLDRAVDEALARRLVELEELLEMLAAVGRRGRRGVGPLRKSLAERQGVVDSVLDAELERLLMRSGIDGIVMQYEIRTEAGELVARVDAAVPDAKLAVEADGASTRVGRHALQYDVSRQNAIVGEGWLPLRFTWADVVGRPERTLAQIRRFTDRRRGELGVQRSA